MTANPQHRIGGQPQQRRAQAQRTVAAGSEEKPGDDADDERERAEQVQRHAPGAGAEARRLAPVDHVGGGDERHGQADGQPGDGHAEADGAAFRRRVRDDQHAVVGVEDAFAEARQHARHDEPDQSGGQPRHQRQHAGPQQRQHQHLAVPETVAEAPAGVLGEHVAGEEHRADQPAERRRMRRVADEAALGVDHPGHDRAGDGAVGIADEPAEQQEEPQFLIAAGEDRTPGTGGPTGGFGVRRQGRSEDLAHVTPRPRRGWHGLRGSTLRGSRFAGVARVAW